MKNNREEISKSITLIVPTLNEEGNLPYVLPSIPSFVDEILIVDGHSTDNTVEVARKLCPRAKIIYQEGKGKGNALRTGFIASTGNIIVTMDADGSMNPEEISMFVEPLLDGYSFAKGSRFTRGGGTVDATEFRLFGNMMLANATNLLHRSKYTDVTYGYNAIKKHCIGKIELHSNGFSIETEIAIKAKKAGLKTIEIPSFESARISGEAKLQSYSDGWSILKTIVFERFRR